MASVSLQEPAGAIAPTKPMQKSRRQAPFLVLMVAVVGTMVMLLRHHQLGSDGSRNAIAANQRRLTETEASSVHLFTTASFTVVGPSIFPKPSALLGEDARPNLQPTYGEHRPEADAVFVLAAEYGFNTYLCFVESLRRTGYTGDIVFAVSILDIKEKGVKEYLTTSEHIVTYVLKDLVCFNAENEATDSSKGGIRVCQLHHLYADASDKPLQDPRDVRTLATTRYELYWIWSTHYKPNVWVMLLDARDSYFQTNPFDTVPRDESADKKSGILHLFGENTDATRIGKSVKNRKWLETAYGEVVVTALQDKPTICSGSTMGEQVAIETYLRSMVGESDETGTKLMGADQGFHNYLYYSNKLMNAETIHSIIVFDQGRGAINNMGAMRTAPLEEWGNGHILDQQSNTSMTVLNWDGSISPVVHQFDRHQVLSKYVYKHQTNLFREAYFAKLGVDKTTTTR